MIKLLKKYWPVTGIALILIMMGFYLFKPLSIIVEEPDSGGSGQDGLRLENVHYVQDDPGEGVKWILDAEKVRFSEDNQRISFDNFELNLSPDTERSIRLNGDMGNFNRSQKKLELKGRLKGLTNDGYRLSADHIIFSQDEGTLKSEEKIYLSGPFFTVKGRGLHVDIAEMNMKILHDVTALIDRTLLIP